MSSFIHISDADVPSGLLPTPAEAPPLASLQGTLIHCGPQNFPAKVWGSINIFNGACRAQQVLVD